jgi:hypothetical protein
MGRIGKVIAGATSRALRNVQEAELPPHGKTAVKEAEEEGRA